MPAFGAGDPGSNPGRATKLFFTSLLTKRLIRALIHIKYMSESEIIAVTTPSTPDYKTVRVLGIVHGITARTPGVGGKILGGLQSLIGGEVSAFTSEMDKAKNEALEQSGRCLGANAIIGVDFETTEVFQSVVLLSANGTAVLVEKET